MLWSNVKALLRLKKNGKKIGKLRYKKKGRYKSLNFNQSGFSIDVEKNRISLSKIGSVKAIIHREIEGKGKRLPTQLSKYYVNNYNTIYVEELNIKKLVRKGKAKTLHRYILGASWGEFIERRILSYKAEGAGKTLTKVSPQYTSKKCAVCREITTELKLSDRMFVCPEYNWGSKADRGYNASLNILKIKTGARRPVATAERILENSPNHFLQ